MPVVAETPLIGMGCMRLSTEANRDETSAIATLHAAFDAGVNFLDTSDAYCRDAAETGHNERLIARALASWSGDASRIMVATKGGLTRPDGRWVADGRARHLAAACEASLRALGVERLPLYQLHAPDPRVPLSTSVRSLAALQRDGMIDAIGLCNVTVGQLEEAMRIAPIATVQVELSLWNDDNILSGVVESCIANGIRLLAYRPLGGSKQRRRVASDPILNDLAARHAGTPFEIAIAALRDLSPAIVPLPGPTRVETAQSASRACRIALAAEDRARLDERFPAARALRFRERSLDRPAPAAVDGEIVMIMGLPGAGKSTVAETLVARGYERLNRDLAGGSLRGLLPAIASGSSRLVLDNTYVTRKARAAVIQAAWQRQLPVRCVWLATSLEDAQLNAATRIVSRYGRLLSPEELRETSKRDPAAFAPAAQFRYQRELEPPDASEGFAQLEVMPFERRPDPSLINRSVIVWCDGVLWQSRSGRRTPASADDVEAVAGRAEILRDYAADGWRILGLSWQPEIADETVDSSAVDAALGRLRELLGLAIEIEYCPHAAGPPVCWCRKPLPGLGVLFIHRHKLDPTRCIYVGAGPQDPGFARRLGFQYREAAEFFA
jgi:aryl-alcohol dehydrogenase-like predicted oxidoreductase/histidinol phosphatase-like enzyme